MNDMLISRLKSLKLSGIVKTLDLRNEKAIKNNLSYMEFLKLLINDEVLNRQNNSNKNRIRKAKFPHHKTLEEYRFNYKPTVNKRFVNDKGTFPLSYTRYFRNIGVKGDDFFDPFLCSNA